MMETMNNIENIEDDDVLESMAMGTEDISLKLAVRRRQKVLREKRFAALEAAKLERQKLMEDATTMRLRMAEVEKQRHLQQFEEQARMIKDQMGASEKAVRLRQTLADEEKKRKLDQYKQMALVMTASYNSGVEDYLEEKLGRKPRSALAEANNSKKLSGFGGTAYGGRSGATSVERTPTQINGTPGNFNADTVKKQLMEWCKTQVAGYNNVNITNFSSSWSDGLAFCALIHHFHPEAFDFSKLTPQNRRGNFSLAFSTAEKLADIYPMLDVEDMVKMKTPDWKSVFTYVQAFHQKFSKGTPSTGAE